jgi:hypothetical protein
VNSRILHFQVREHVNKIGNSIIQLITGLSFSMIFNKNRTMQEEL